jgi:hypothetical protein
MLECWNDEPARRPKFTDIKNVLVTLLDEEMKRKSEGKIFQNLFVFDKLECLKLASNYVFKNGTAH